MQLDHAPFDLVLPRRQHILVFWIARIERVAAAQYDAPIRIRHIESAGAAKREIHIARGGERGDDRPEGRRGAFRGFREPIAIRKVSATARRSVPPSVKPRKCSGCASPGVTLPAMKRTSCVVPSSRSAAKLSAPELLDGSSSAKAGRAAAPSPFVPSPLPSPPP